MQQQTSGGFQFTAALIFTHLLTILCKIIAEHSELFDSRSEWLRKGNLILDGLPLEGVQGKYGIATDIKHFKRISLSNRSPLIAG